MNAKPLFVGVLAVTALGGATTGATLNTQPLTARADPLAYIPDHPVEHASRAQIVAMTAPQDQYALETPEGRIEIAELAYHGRLREERERYLAWAEGRADYALYSDEEIEAEMALAANPQWPEQSTSTESASTSGVSKTTGSRSMAGEDTREPSADVLAPPARLAIREATQSDPNSDARLVNVSAELAANE